MCKNPILILWCCVTLIGYSSLGQSGGGGLKAGYNLEDLCIVPSPSVDSVKAVYIDVTRLKTEQLDVLEKYTFIENVSVYYSVDEHTGDIRSKLIKLKYLQRIFLSIDSCDVIPDLFSGVKQLRQISIQANKFNSMPYSLCQLEELEELNISSSSSNSLPEWIGKIKGLKVLTIDMDNLIKLPESFGSLSQLEILVIESNRLSQIQKSFGNLTSLKEIELFAPELRRFDVSFRNMDSLISLDLKGMPLLKSLPKDLNQAENLKSFAITNARKLTSVNNLINSNKLEVLSLTEVPFSKYIKVIQSSKNRLSFYIGISDFLALNPKQAQILNGEVFDELGMERFSLSKQGNDYWYRELPVTEDDLQKVRKLLPNYLIY